MDCASCGRANRPAARFCGGCGQPLAPRCPSCGIEAETGATFCDACGASLGLGQPVAGARKVVTIVFADLIGSTALQERLDAESVRALMDRYYRALHEVVASHGGTVVKLLGDGVMAAFGVPRVREDDAVRAVRAAVGMQRAFHAVIEQRGALGLRVGVNTGEVVVSADHADVVGDPVNVAARLQEAASDGEVLIGEATCRLVADMVTLASFGDLALKGRSDTVAVHRVVSLDRPGGAAATPFVGRKDEVHRLTAVYESAVAASAGRMALVLGSPGLGKSRLLLEVTRRLGERAVVLVARCDPAGGATFAPLAAALRPLLRLDGASGLDAAETAIESVLPADESERTRIVSGIAGLMVGTPSPPDETFFVVRRLLAALARRGPVVLVIDDLQWAEPLLLDLTEHLVQWSAGTALFVLAAARPELRDVRASLAAPSALVTDVLTLGGLDADAATQLAASVIGAEALPAALAGRVLATSEGNPLFVAELVRMLVHDGVLARDGERWTVAVEPAALEMPPTIQALLAARIERLRPEDRVVLERAAVIGRHFPRAGVAHLLGVEGSRDLDARLESLRRSELVEVDAGSFGGPGLRFHHALVRDAAYRRLLKETRAELHAAFAEWLEEGTGGAVEHDETIGRHLEQAHQYLGELGAMDARGRSFGERAARHLAAAGRRALEHEDVPLAAGLLGRALARLEADDPARAELALDRCEALLAAGDVGPAADAVAELGRLAGHSERLQAWHTCFSGELAVAAAPHALHATADAVAAAAERMAAAGDAAGEAKAHAVHATALARLGRIGDSEAALDRALAAARRGHDRRRANAVLGGAPAAALWGPSPIARASGRCLDVVRVLRTTLGSAAVEAVALRCQGILEALRGRADAARRMVASSRRVVEELGITSGVLEADVFFGLIALIEGDAPEAERAFRAAYEGLRAHGLRVDAARAAALLGRALLLQGRASEAEAMSSESEALAGDDLKAAILWRGVRAEALAHRGAHAAAVDLARAAVDIAAATDALLDHADARVALAAVLRAAGRDEEAAAEEIRAGELWDAKGATLLADRVRRSAATAAPVAPSGSGVRATATLVSARVDAGIAAGDDAALARLHTEDMDALTVPASPRLPNAATRGFDAFADAWEARDWDRIGALIAPGFRQIDRRTTLRLDLDRQGFVEMLRLAATMQTARFSMDVLATRGDRLMLGRACFTGSAAGAGLSEVPWLTVTEVDAAGKRLAMVSFDVDALDDAYAELDRRYDAGEAATFRHMAMTRAFLRAFAARDWDGLAALLAPELVVHDHRLLGWEPLHGPGAYLQALRSLVELAPDVRLRVDHVRMAPGAIFYVPVWVGTREGGAFETPSVFVAEVDEGDRIRRFDQYDLEQLADARERFAAAAYGGGEPSGGRQ